MKRGGMISLKLAYQITMITRYEFYSHQRRRRARLDATRLNLNVL